MNKNHLFPDRVVISFAIVLMGLPSCRKKETAPSKTVANVSENQSADKRTQSVDETIKELMSAWSKVSAFSAAVETHLTQAIGKPGRTTGEGRFDLSKGESGDQIRFKLDNVLQVDYEDGSGKKWVTAEFLEWVSDGHILHQWTSQYQLNQVTRSRYEPDQLLQMAGKDLFRSLRRDHRLETMPDETLNGMSVAVIEAKPKGAGRISLHYFDRRTGIRIKMVEKDAGGNETFTLTLSDINVEPDFSAEHFVFSMPEDAELIDKTVTGSKKVISDK